VLREFRALVGVLIALAADAAEEVDAARAFFDDMPFPVRVPWPTTVRQCWGCWPMCASADSMSWGPRQGLSRLSVEEGRLHGRATRLFVSPVLQSLEQLTGASSFLPYLQAFRYPLAGAFASTRGLAMTLRVPCDWGLEIGLLSEVYRHVAICRIAQVGLGTFDHKHKAIGAGPDEGLQRMCCEGLASLLQGLMEHESRALTGEQAVGA